MNEGVADDSDEQASATNNTNVVRLSKVNSSKLVKSVRKVPEIMVNMQVNGSSLNMELDTEASVSVIFKKLYDRLGW